MKLISQLSIVIIILSSCASTTKLEVSEIRTAYIEYNPITAINFGNEIEARVMVLMNDGTEIDVTNSRKLNLVSEDIVRSTSLSKKFKIIKHPTSFEDNTANIQITVTDKEEVFQITDSVRMNFKGDLNIDAQGANGFDGESQNNRSDRLLLRDGKHGENGTNGSDGQNSDVYESKIWSENGLTYVYVRNQRTNEIWRYKTLGEGKINFNLQGGNGGNGGDGGDGGNGRDGALSNGKYTRPGNGGDGGHGGNSGNGGNGGTVHITIHPNNSQIETKLMYFTDGGNRGNTGKGGKAGKPGTPVTGQTPGKMGRTGISGRSGRNGLDGIVNPLSFTTFDFNQFK
jgi:hypothetical protein